MIPRRWAVESFTPAGSGYWIRERRFWTLAGAQKHAGRRVASWRGCTNYRIRDRKHETTYCVVARTSDIAWQVREETDMPIARMVE